MNSVDWLAEGTSLAEVVAGQTAGEPPPADAGLFGANLAPSAAQLVLIPVPWDATTSYGGGSAFGPAAITMASHQLDLEDPVYDRPYAAGIAMLGAAPMLATASALARGLARGDKAAVSHHWHALFHELPDQQGLPELRASLQQLGEPSEVTSAVDAVNAIGLWVHERVERAAEHWLAQGKIVGVLGGDHSCPLGLMKALAKASDKPFGILHIDAHLDLRQAYEGFTYSHASIMYNALQAIPDLEKLVQIGIRDYSAEEMRLARADARIEVMRDYDLQAALLGGSRFTDLAKNLIDQLPQRVYVSFDIDGLDPVLCPSTGTPVPGGLSYIQANLLLDVLVASGRQIIGFDLCEVAPRHPGASEQLLADEWDANVGARVLYRMSAASLASHGLCAGGAK